MSYSPMLPTIGRNRPRRTALLVLGLLVDLGEAGAADGSMRLYYLKQETRFDFSFLFLVSWSPAVTTSHIVDPPVLSPLHLAI